MAQEELFSALSEILCRQNDFYLFVIQSTNI